MIFSATVTFLHRLGLLLAVLFFVGPGGIALAQSNDTRALVDRLNRVESDLTTLQRQVYRGGPPPANAPGGPPPAAPGGDAINRLSERLDQMDEQIRTLTGRVEEVEYQQTQAKTRLDKFAEDAEFRFKQLEKSGVAPQVSVTPGDVAAPAAPQTMANGAPVLIPPPADTAAPGLARPPANLGQMRTGANGAPLPPDPGAPAAPAAPARAAPQQQAALPAAKLPPGSPLEQYNYAFGVLRQGDNAQAEAVLGQFVTANPSDPLVGNAKFWIGKLQLLRNDNEKAAATFLDVYKNYPKGQKAPESLLNLGTALNNLNQKKEACTVLVQLGKEFPQQASGLKPESDRERTRGGCK